MTGNHPKIVTYKLLFCPRDFMLAFETNSICEIQHCLLVFVQNDSPMTSRKKCRKKCLVMEILSSVAKGVESIRILNSSIFSQHTYPQSEESKCKMCVIEKRTNLVGDTQCVKITFLVPKFCVNCDQLFSEKSQLFEFQRVNQSIILNSEIQFFLIKNLNNLNFRAKIGHKLIIFSFKINFFFQKKIQ